MNTEHLINRYKTNQMFGKNNFDEWTDKLITDIKFKSVLDVCCGTGNQLVKYMRPGTVVTGIDISKEALKIAEGRVKGVNLINVAMEDMFVHPDIKDKSFDLISCFYGLYYSKDVNKTLCEMLEHLSESGIILIVGSIGQSNESLFSVLRKYYDIPEFVTKSCSSFILSDVVPTLDKLCSVRTKYFHNEIVYSKASDLMDYLRSTTYFKEEYTDDVKQDIEKIISLRGNFIVKKEVMAVIAQKRTFIGYNMLAR